MCITFKPLILSLISFISSFSCYAKTHNSSSYARDFKVLFSRVAQWNAAQVVQVEYPHAKPLPLRRPCDSFVQYGNVFLII